MMAAVALQKFLYPNLFHLTCVTKDVAAAPQTPQLGGGPGQLWGPKLV